MNTYHQGAVVRLSVVFTEDGAAVDPAAVWFFISSDSGGTELGYDYPSDPEIVKDSTGHYHVDFPIPTNGAGSAGRYAYRWEGRGTHQSADEQFFHVNNSEIYG